MLFWKNILHVQKKRKIHLLYIIIQTLSVYGEFSQTMKYGYPTEPL